MPTLVEKDPGRLARRRAWLSLLLFPLSLVAAFVVGEGLADLLGYPAGTDETAPFWVAVVAGVPAMLVFAVPGLMAWRLGRTAARLGQQRGMVPAVIGAVLAGGFVLQNVAAYVVATVSG